MKKNTIVLLSILAFVTLCAFVQNEPKYVVRAMNEDVKLDSLVVFKVKIDSAIDVMSEVKGATSLQVEILK